MYLKSLTLKGFKSFAAPTTLRFEPGICAVVGPNGSGKSNVVDALTWVMGEQGAKTLRGGTMQDVIFAGTAAKAALGRAEVTLTIDNHDGALPIEYAEVSVTRRMYRDGAGEYEINGHRARLMDVQELLSDSGIGREMHVIVGQGKLAEILESRPEERRAFIEEAAGILKHRRRKEKAHRKLIGMQGNLDRLTDLTKELRRQLGPLARQAEVARRAHTVQAELRDASLRLAADDLVTRRTDLADIDTARAELAVSLAAAVEERDGLAARAQVLTTRVAELTSRAEAAQQRWFALSALGERARATARIASERQRSLAAAQPGPTGPDPAELDRQAGVAAEREAQLERDVVAATAALTAAGEHLAAAERASATLEDEHLRAVQAVADRREGLARLAGQADTAAARIESLTDQIARHTEELQRARDAVAAADDDFSVAEARLGPHAESEAHLTAALEAAESRAQSAAARVTELRDQETTAGRSIAALEARIETLRTSLGAGDGTAWLATHLGEQWLGTLAEHIHIDSGAEKAIGVALGAVAEAGVVPSDVALADALAALAAAGKGRATMIQQQPAARPWRLEATLVPGARWAMDTVRAPAALTSQLAFFLADVVIADSLSSAQEQISADPRLRAVTTDGTMLGSGWMSGGGAAARSGVEVSAAIEAAETERRAAVSSAERAAASLAGAEAAAADVGGAAEAARAAITESDQHIEDLYRELARLGLARRRAAAECRRVEQARQTAREKLDAARREHAELRQRLEAASAEQPADLTDTRAEERAAAAAAVVVARDAETEARLAVRTAEERHTAGRGKAASLRRAAAAEREARARAVRAAAARRRGEQVAATVVELSARLHTGLEQITGDAAVYRDRLIALRDTANAELHTAQQQLREVETTVTTLGDSAQRDEIARAALAAKVEDLEASVVERLGIEPDTLVAEYGPDCAIAPSPQEMEEYELARERGEDVTAPHPMPYVRREQQARKARAEKDLAALGKVNPLALEEYAALEERHAFLAAQLDDLKRARADLEGVIEDVDARIEQIFTEAFWDVEREFREVFQVLFPGGEGRLMLTDPQDMLATGIEVEARPPGKKVKRLSLLSGGEKSLTAVAMLVAIFKARPSPFYVMDEVEAALDDTNLRRLLTLFEQLRETSQLIVITHQKPTMDVADVLYGVSMQGDGISKVISQRMTARSAPG